MSTHCPHCGLEIFSARIASCPHCRKRLKKQIQIIEVVGTLPFGFISSTMAFYGVGMTLLSEGVDKYEYINLAVTGTVLSLIALLLFMFLIMRK